MAGSFLQGCLFALLLPLSPKHKEGPSEAPATWPWDQAQEHLHLFGSFYFKSSPEDAVSNIFR